MTRPAACNFEKLTQNSLHNQEDLGIVAKICFHYERDLSELIKLYSPWNHQINIDFLKISGGKKINYFAQIESIMEGHFGYNLLQVLFLTLFMLGSVGVHFSNNFGIIVFVVVVIIIISTLFIYLFILEEKHNILNNIKI